MSELSEEDEIRFLLNLHKPLLEKSITSGVSNHEENKGEMVDVEEMDLEQMENFLEHYTNSNISNEHLKEESDELKEYSKREFEDLLEDAIVLQKIKDIKSKTSLYSSLDKKVVIHSSAPEKGMSNDGHSDLPIQLVSQCSGNNLIFQRSTDDQILETIDLNLAMQATLGELEIKLISELSVIQNRREEVEEEVRKHLDNLEASKRILCGATKTKLKHCRTWYYKFGIPYFKDERYYKCPPNEDFKERLRKKEFITTTSPRLIKWRNKHKIMLQHGVKQCLINERLEKYKKKFNYKKLKENTLKDLGKEKVKIVTKKLDDFDSTLRRIRLCDYKKLIAKEDPNREYDWLKISATEFNAIFSDDECRRMWHMYVKPSINKNKWTDKEDHKLIQLAKDYGEKNWDIIAEELGTHRSGYQCIVHYQTRLNPNIKKIGKWTEDDDDLLKELVNQFRVGDFIPWRRVSYYFPNRTRSQVAVHWNCSLDPSIIKGRFTQEEDLTILTGIKRFRLMFSEVSEIIEGRSTQQIRDRYRSLDKKPDFRRGIWSMEEDKLLLELVEQYGESNWSLISNHLRTRNRTQVRHRYRTIFSILHRNPDIKNVDDIKRKHSIEPHGNVYSVIENTPTVVSRINKILEDRKFCRNISSEKCVSKKRSSHKNNYIAESKLNAFFKDSYYYQKKWKQINFSKGNILELGRIAEALCKLLAVQFDYRTSQELSNDERLPNFFKLVVQWLEGQKICEFKRTDGDKLGDEVNTDEQGNSLCSDNNADASCAVAVEKNNLNTANVIKNKIDLPLYRDTVRHDITNILELIPQRTMSVYTMIETPLFCFANLNLFSDIDKAALTSMSTTNHPIIKQHSLKEKHSKTVQIPKVEYCVPPNLSTMVTLNTILKARDKILRCVTSNANFDYDDTASTKKVTKPKAETQKENTNGIRLTKEEAMQLWHDRLFSILSCPITMSRNAPGMIPPDSILYSGSVYQHDAFIHGVRNSMKRYDNISTNSKKKCMRQSKNNTKMPKQNPELQSCSSKQIVAERRSLRLLNKSIMKTEQKAQLDKTI